jgi:hypothetical protein
VREDFSISNDDRSAESTNFFFGDGFEDNFRPDACRIAHRYPDARLRFG